MSLGIPERGMESVPGVEPPPLTDPATVNRLLSTTKRRSHMSLSPENLEAVAWALDAMTKLTRVLLEPIAAMDEVNASTMEVCVEVTRDGEPMTPADARTLLEWLGSDEMQDDLRAEAAAIEGAT